MDDPAADIKKKVDAMIGSYEEGPRDRLARFRNFFLTWVVGALLAVIAAATIVLIIESHRLPREIPVPKAKPVPVQIIPSPKS